MTPKGIEETSELGKPGSNKTNEDDSQGRCDGRRAKERIDEEEMDEISGLEMAEGGRRWRGQVTQYEVAEEYAYCGVY